MLKIVKAIRNFIMRGRWYRNKTDERNDRALIEAARKKKNLQKHISIL